MAAANANAPVAYDELPPRYHRWKWQILISFCAFYLFVYTGRFNFWPTSPLIKDDLALTNIEIGVINAMLSVGVYAGRPGARAAVGGLRAAVVGNAGGSPHDRFQLGRVLRHVGPHLCHSLGPGRLRQRGVLVAGHQHDQPVVAPARARHRHGVSWARWPAARCC